MTRITLQSDNGACYTSREFTVGLAALATVTGVAVSRLIHTEAQDGKSHLDGSFGLLSQAIRRYVDENHDITTAEQLADAVRAANAANTIVRLVKLDPARMIQLGDAVGKSMPDLPTLRTFKDIWYTPAGLQLWRFSGIGPSYLIEAADLQRWWVPTSLHVLYEELSEVRQRRRHRRRQPAQDSSSSSSEQTTDEERTAALAVAGYVRCRSCQAEVYSAQHDVGACPGPRTIEHRAIDAAFRLQAAGVVQFPRAAGADLEAVIIQSLAHEPRRILESGWAKVAHNTVPMQPRVAQALDQMFASETERNHCSAQQAMSRLESLCT